jgi:hypothetical protein
MFPRVRGAYVVFIIAMEREKPESVDMKARVIVVDPEEAVRRGRLLRELRRSAGSTLNDLTQRSKVSKRRLAAAEGARRPLTPAEWRLVRRALRRMIGHRIAEGLRGLESLSA